MRANQWHLRDYTRALGSSDRCALFRKSLRQLDGRNRHEQLLSTSPRVAKPFSPLPILWKILRTCQQNFPQARIADTSSTNAVSLSSACTTNRFPSQRWASATHIIRPSLVTADTQPQLHPALLRLSAIVSQEFTQ